MADGPQILPPGSPVPAPTPLPTPPAAPVAAPPPGTFTNIEVTTRGDFMILFTVDHGRFWLAFDSAQARQLGNMIFEKAVLADILKQQSDLAAQQAQQARLTAAQ